MAIPVLAAVRSLVLSPSAFDPNITALHWPAQPAAPLLLIGKSTTPLHHITLFSRSLHPSNIVGTASFPKRSTAQITLRGTPIQMHMNPWSTQCKVDAGHMGVFTFQQDGQMGSEALDMFDAGGTKLARIDRAGKHVKRLDVFQHFDGNFFEMVVLTALAAWTIHKELDKAVLKGVGEAIFSL